MADIDEIDGVSDEEVEALTAGEVLQKLEEVHLNFYINLDTSSSIVCTCTSVSYFELAI